MYIFVCISSGNEFNEDQPLVRGKKPEKPPIPIAASPREHSTVAAVSENDVRAFPSTSHVPFSGEDGKPPKIHVFVFPERYTYYILLLSNYVNRYVLYIYDPYMIHI